MPQTPFADVLSLDPTRVLANRAQIYAQLKQAGRFALLDGIAHYDPVEQLSIGFKDIRADDWWTTDHIPGRPLFPGVLMIEAGAHVASWDYMRRNPDQKGFLGFGGLDNARFRGMVEPGVRMHWIARASKVRSRMFVYSIQGLVAGEIVFEGDVIGIVL